jgi:hypothetical protein
MQIEQHIPEPLGSAVVPRLTAALGLTAGIAGSAGVAFYDPAEVHFFPVCPLYAITGFACPGCGLTRGFHALFHGDVLTALHFNALILAWAVVFAYVGLSLAMLAVRGRGLPMWPTSPRFLWIFMVALLAFGVLRNVPVYPLTLLYP